MSDAMKGTWKKLFFLLFDNLVPDDELPDMWTHFKKDNLQRSVIMAAIESVKDNIQENEREELERVFSEKSDSDAAQLLCLMKECAELKDKTWHRLFTAIRDRVSRPNSSDNKVPIVEGGRTRLMSLQDIEKKLILEDPDIFTSQTSVPDQMIHEDLIDAQFNTTAVRDSLKKSFENKLSSLKTTLAVDNPKWKTSEIEKQAAAQAKKETKNSKEAVLLRQRVALMAEQKVQKHIERVMKEYNIPALVLRGVRTYEDIGKFLESFGIKVSPLKAFKHGDVNWTSTECEHDIVTMALLPTGPHVYFTQVTQSLVPTV